MKARATLAGMRFKLRAGVLRSVVIPPVALFEAAHVMMTRVARWFPLKAWAMRAAGSPILVVAPGRSVSPD